MKTTPLLFAVALIWAAIGLGALALSSCGTCVHVSAAGDTTVQAGVLSSIQQVTTKVTPSKNGTAPTVTVVQTGYDGTSVANNGIGVIGTKVITDGTTDVTNSNNALSGLKDTNGTKVSLQKGAPAVIGAKGTAATGVAAAKSATSG